MAKKSLYVNRPLANAEEFIEWAKSQGFEKITEPADLHVTVLYSKGEVDWAQFELETDKLTVKGGKRKVEPLGDEGAVVLKFDTQHLQDRHDHFVDGGATHDYDSYKPHVTITYDGQGVDLGTVEPYAGPLIFGPEEFEEIDGEWKPKESSVSEEWERELKTKL